MRTVCSCLLPALTLLGLCSSARAQSALDDAEVDDEGWAPVVALTYSMALPTGDTRPLFDELSLVGFEYSMFVPLAGRWYFGITAGYNELEDDDGRRTYPLDDGALTGTFYRSASIASLALATRYYVGGPRWFLRPFFGARVGVSFADVSYTIVDRTRDEALVGLLAAPEAGLALRFADGFGIVLGYQYVYTTSSSSRLDELAYHCFNVGPQLRY